MLNPKTPKPQNPKTPKPLTCDFMLLFSIILLKDFMYFISFFCRKSFKIFRLLKQNCLNFFFSFRFSCSCIANILDLP